MTGTAQLYTAKQAFIKPTDIEVEAAVAYIERQRPRRPAWNRWIDGTDPKPPSHQGEGTSGPWPVLSISVVKAGVSVYRNTDQEDAEGKAWTDYWREANDDCHPGGSLKAAGPGCPPVPTHGAGVFALVPWALIRTELRGEGQPSLFADLEASPSLSGETP